MTYFPNTQRSKKDEEFFKTLPQELQEVLSKKNGYVSHGGGFHLRGVCHKPKWHSLEEVFVGEHALFDLFEFVEEDDIPFAEDCMGDQFLLREGQVIRLYAESGDMEELGLTLEEFMDKVKNAPSDVLDLEVMELVTESDAKLHPGEVMVAHPPFVMEESEEGVQLEAMPCLQALMYYSQLSFNIQSVAKENQVTEENS